MSPAEAPTPGNWTRAGAGYQVDAFRDTLVLLLSGCDLFPVGTFQGRLTNANGNPLNGQYRLIFKFYHSATGGTAIYTETKTLTVTNGLFDTAVGPTLTVLDPEELARPIWVELTVSDRVAITETLTPR